MRKGQLIRKVLKAYKFHIQHLRENFQEATEREIEEYLDSYEISRGICWYLNCTLEVNRYAGYNAKWVQKYIPQGEVGWGIYPNRCSELESVLESLQIRVDVMEKELASGENLHQRIDSRNYSK